MVDSAKKRRKDAFERLEPRILYAKSTAATRAEQSSDRQEEEFFNLLFHHLNGWPGIVPQNPV